MSAPWSAEDFLRTATTALAGFAVSVVAWYLARGEDALADQMRWANLSVGGFVLGSYGMVLWLLRGRRAVGERRRQLLGEPDMKMVAVVAPAATASAVLVGGDGLRRYHRADCALAADRGFAVADRAAHEAAGRQPCGVCRPELWVDGGVIAPLTTQSSDVVSRDE